MNRYGGADMGVCRKRGAFACRCTMRRATATDAACRRRQSSGSSRRERPTTGVQGGALQRGSGGRTAVSQARERHEFERALALLPPPVVALSTSRVLSARFVSLTCVSKKGLERLPPPAFFFGPGGGRKKGWNASPPAVFGAGRWSQKRLQTEAKECVLPSRFWDGAGGLWASRVLCARRYRLSRHMNHMAPPGATPTEQPYT